MKHLVATIHVVVEVEDDLAFARASDVISEVLRDIPEIKDWGYAETLVDVDNGISKGHFACPVEVTLPEPYEECDFYNVIPPTHRIVR